MFLLKAKCPRCRAEVNTGLLADEQTLQELGPKLQVLVLCDACEEYQKMLVQELYRAEDIAA